MDISSPAENGWPKGGAMSWAQVLAVQDWLQVVVMIAAAVIAATTMTNDYYDRPFSVYDATISFPVQANIISYWVAIVVPMAAALLSIWAFELWHGHRAGVKAAVALALHFTLDFYSSFTVTLAVTQALKVSVGRLRPNFLAACQPGLPPLGNVTIAFGLPASANPPCTAPPSPALIDEHYSWPSGHTSTAFVQAVYGSIYCAWAFSWRTPGTAAARLAGAGARLRHDCAALAGILWICLQLSFAWGVGASRVRDFHHHASDVATGALLGLAFGSIFALRGIGRRGLVVPEAVRAGAAGEASSELRDFEAL